MSSLPPECQQLLISGYVSGNLSPAESALFAEMLRENPELRQQVTTMQQASTTSTERVKTQNFQISRLKLSWILGAIALFMIAILGINNYRLWRTVQTNNVVETARRTYLLQRELSNSQAKLVVARDRLNATLTANNLPPLPPDKAYALWTIVGKDVPYTTDEKGAVLTAVFQVNEAGNFSQEIALPQPHLEPKTIRKIAITVEDVFAPQAHTGSIFISTQ